MNQMINHTLNWADYFIIVVILFSTLISLMRGFISEAISLVTWVVAAVIAFKSAVLFGNLLSGLIHSPTVRLVIGFIFVLIIILILGSLINHFLGAFIRSTGLSGTNRLLGMVFGFARGVLLVALLILVAKMTSVVRESWWHTSLLIPYFQGIVNWLQQFIPLHLSDVSQFFAKSKAGNV